MQLSETSEDYLKRIIFDLVFYARSTIRATEDLVSLRHDQHLLPEVEGQLEVILAAFDRYRRVVSNVQGVMDRGVDVLVKYAVSEDSKDACHIGFQIKSHKEVETEKDLLKTIKAGLHDARRAYNLQDYYLFLCGGLPKTAQRIQIITAEVADTVDCHVVNPRYVTSFISLSKARIEAYIKRRLGKDDAVLREAEYSLQECSLQESAVLIFLVSKWVFERKTEVDVEEILQSQLVKKVFADFPAYPAEWLEDDYADDDEFEEVRRRSTEQLSLQELLDRSLQNLEDVALQIDPRTQVVRLLEEHTLPIEALALDGRVRLAVGVREVEEYLFHLLKADAIRVAEGYAGRASD